MLGKLALTLAVIIIAALFIRHRARSQRTAGRGAESARRETSNPWQREADNPGSPEIPVASRSPGLRPAIRKVLLWGSLAAVFAAGAGLYYLAWQDAREPVTVILHSGNGNPVTYEVRKRDLGERSFTTLEGTEVTVADSERMEVIGL